MKFCATAAPMTRYLDIDRDTRFQFVNRGKPPFERIPITAT